MFTQSDEKGLQPLLHVFESIHSNTLATPSCHSVAMTFILDTHLPIRFHLQEPPPSSPVPSHHRFLFAFLTGVGFRSSTATPLRYPSNLGSTMWFGATIAVGVECLLLFYPRVMVIGLPYHHTPLLRNLPSNSTPFKVVIVVQ
jgi:hypothetical protein